MMATTIWRRDVNSALNTVKDAPQTLGSWGSCMQKTWCKWPAIIGAIIGAVILISVLWCCIRCCCCGLSCCCGCFPCCRRRKRGHKHLDDPPPTPHGNASGASGGYQYGPKPPMYEPPQFATFDVSKKPVHEDALPEMPTIESANTRRVLDDSPVEQKDVELSNLDPATAQKRPMLGDVSPVGSYRGAGSARTGSPYQDPHTGAGGTGSRGAGAGDEFAPGASPPLHGGQQAHSPPPGGMRRNDNGYGLAPSRSPGPGGMQRNENGYGLASTRSPPPNAMQGSDNGYSNRQQFSRSPPPMHDEQKYGGFGPQRQLSASPAPLSYPHDGYGYDEPRGWNSSPAPPQQAMYGGVGGGGGAGGYGRPSPASPPPGIHYQNDYENPYDRPVKSSSPPPQQQQYAAYSPTLNQEPAYKSPQYQPMPSRSSPSQSGPRPPSALTPGRRPVGGGSGF